MNLSSVVRWVEGLQGPLPYAAVLLVAFAEHALLIGTLVPGEVILPLVGVVAATTGAVAWLPAALCAGVGGFLATGARLRHAPEPTDGRAVTGDRFQPVIPTASTGR